jgi:hypothetical protein
MDELVKQEQPKWISKYEEGVAAYQAANPGQCYFILANQWDPDAVGGSVAQMIGQDPEGAATPGESDEGPSATAGAGASGATEPKKTSVWTQDMKDTFSQLLDNYQEMVELNKRLA